MNNKFEIGDKVNLKPNMYPVSDHNPLNTLGEIIGITNLYGIINRITVRWVNGIINGYNIKDLDIVITLIIYPDE